MRRNTRFTMFACFVIVFIVSVQVAVFAGGQKESTKPSTGSAQLMMESTGNVETLVRPENSEVAVLAGGCFWGVEAVFELLDGVVDVRSGYSGGEESDAFYNLVASGRTDHAESVEIVYDPEIITYETLLEVFFTVAHDPTQLNYQGPDHGTQYRSAIFYVNDEQRKSASDFIDKLEDSDMYHQPVVTQVVPLDEFYSAEEYHQDFLIRNPQNPYIVYWDIPKLVHLRETYPELLASQEK